MIYNNNIFNTPLTKTNYVFLKELDKSYEFNFILPGFSKENIEITLKDNLIIVNAKSNYITPKGYSLVKSDFGIKDCSLTTIIPDNANKDNITAKLNNGILTIAIEKQAELKKTITIGD